MSTVFPPRAFKGAEIVDPAWLDKTYQPIAEKVFGRINEQDIRSGAFPIAKVYVANGTYSFDKGAYTNKWLNNRAVDPGFGAAVSAASPSGWFLSSTKVADSIAWQPISFMEVAVTTGEDVLWIVGMMQYAAFKGTGTSLVSPTTPSEDEARVQFAIRIDGVVISETVTGSNIFPDSPNQMLYRGTADTNNYDYRHVRIVQNTEGIGGAAKPVRMTYSVPVVEGDHLVEIVARRLPQSPDGLDNEPAPGDPGIGSEVCIYNRQLFVLACNAYGDTVSTMSGSSVKSFDENEVLSQASLFTNRLSVVANRMNILPTQSLERGTLRRTHLPRAVNTLDLKSISDDDPKTYTQVYDNYNDNGNWETVQTGSGTLLRITNSGAGWNLSTNPGWMIIMANVQLWDITQSTHAMRTSVMGCFTIRMYDGAAYHNVMNGLTEVFCTNDAFYLSGPSGVGAKDDTDFAFEDVPLFLAVDTATLAGDIGGNVIQYIEVSVAGWRGKNPGFADLKTNGGFLTAWIQER
jgi:hypothetical protein